jgi:rare lipoprotein A
MKLVWAPLILILVGCFEAPAHAAPQNSQVGLASYYRHNGRTASGERLNSQGFTAAHRSLAFGTRVRVTNLKTRKSVVVRINDRGPFVHGRIIDLAFGAAEVIGLDRSGIARVEIVILPEAGILTRAEF